MIRISPFDFRVSFASLVFALSFVATPAQASDYTFQTINNPGDPNFNQLLGISSTASPTIVGYFGDGVVVPNNGYTYTAPATFNAENFPGSAQTQVVGIAPNAGVNVGFYVDGAGNNFGFVDSSGTFTSVSNPNVSNVTAVTQLLGVNDSGIAVGFYTDASGNNHGFTYNVNTQAFTPINPPGAVSTTATGINDSGVITGFYTDASGNTHGFVDNGGVFTEVSDPNGPTSTMLFGINASDVIVGSYVDGSGLTNGLLFNASTDSFTTIDDPLASAVSAFGVNGTTINGINNAGDLVGFYSDGNNVDGFEATAATPEPASVWLLLTGACICLAARARLCKQAVL